MLKKRLQPIFIALVAVFFFFPFSVSALTFSDELYSNTSHNSYVPFGRSSVNQQYASIEYTHDLNSWLCSMSFRADYQAGTPTDNAVVALYLGDDFGDWTYVTSTIYTPAQFNLQNITWNFTPCYGVASGTKMYLKFSRSGPGDDFNFYTFGYSDLGTYTNPQISIYNWGAWQAPIEKRPYLIINGTDDPQDTFGIQVLNLEASSSSQTLICPDWGLFTPLCDFTVWAFVPNSERLSDRYWEFSNALYARFPFSYASSVWSVFSYVPTSTDEISYYFDVHYNTTTSFGSFLPNKVQFFSSSTIQSYGSSATWQLMRDLVEIVMYVSTVGFIFWGIQRMLEPKE